MTMKRLFVPFMATGRVIQQQSLSSGKTSMMLGMLQTGRCKGCLRKTTKSSEMLLRNREMKLSESVSIYSACFMQVQFPLASTCTYAYHIDQDCKFIHTLYKYVRTYV